MRILHIASITDNSFSGVCVVVPQHVLAQSAYASVGFVNVNGETIPSLKDYQLACPQPFRVESLYNSFGRPDLVVFQECYRPAYLAIARSLRREGIPYVILPHGELGSEAQKIKRLKKMAANLLLFNRFARQAAAIQCLSQRELAQTHFGRRKFIGTNGVFLPSRVKNTYSSSGTRFVYIGRLDAFHKGLDLMLEAVALSAPFLRENHCTLALYGPDYAGRFAHVQELIRQNGVDDLVSLSHEIRGREKEEALLNADVFLQTSRFEGMPLGILEALSYGIPCLVTEGTTLGERIEAAGAGWASRTDSASIAAALRQAVEDRARWDAIGRNARALAERDFAWDAIARSTIDAYQKLLAEEEPER